MGEVLRVGRYEGGRVGMVDGGDGRMGVVMAGVVEGGRGIDIGE